MKDQYKIVYDVNQEEPWGCYRRANIYSFFSKDKGWEKIESVPTREEAETYCQSKNGVFIGTYDTDGVSLAKGDESVRKEGQTYSNSGIPIKKIHAPNSPQSTDLFDIETGTFIGKRVMFRNKN